MKRFLLPANKITVKCKCSVLTLFLLSAGTLFCVCYRSKFIFAAVSFCYERDDDDDDDDTSCRLKSHWGWRLLDDLTDRNQMEIYLFWTYVFYFTFWTVFDLLLEVKWWEWQMFVLVRTEMFINRNINCNILDRCHRYKSHLIEFISK